MRTDHGSSHLVVGGGGAPQSGSHPLGRHQFYTPPLIPQPTQVQVGIYPPKHLPSHRGRKKLHGKQQEIHGTKYADCMLTFRNVSALDIEQCPGYRTDANLSNATVKKDADTD